jgi:hypothetical protein
MEFQWDNNLQMVACPFAIFDWPRVDEQMPFEGVDLIDLTFLSLEYNHYHLVI